MPIPDILKSGVFLILTFSLNFANVFASRPATSIPPENSDIKAINSQITRSFLGLDEDLSMCYHMADCSKHASCITCSFPPNCRLNETILVNCTTKPNCQTQRSFQLQTICRFCWQVEANEELECDEVRNCSTTDIKLHTTTCRVSPGIVCNGQRKFLKKIKCHWTNGYSWTKAMFFSVVLGGVGWDRFYLGLWKSGIGKLFSFGGLGAWTLLDIALIGIGYIQPVDESLYI